MATLADIRNKLKEQEVRSSGNNKTSGGDNAIYPFWNLKESYIINMFTFFNDSKIKHSFKILECKFCKLADKIYRALFATWNQFPVIYFDDSRHDSP